MPPILKLPTLDKQVPHDAVVAFELLRRAHDQVQKQLATLTKQTAAAAASVPTIQELSQALSSGGAAPVTVAGSVGTLPPSPNDETQYLNGAAQPAFAFVEDAHLALFDIVTNNVSLLAHGLMPKLTGDPDQILTGAGEWVSLSALMGRWAPVTNGDPVSPEILFDANGEVIMGFDPAP